MELLKRFPQPNTAFLASCEESIEDIRDYLGNDGDPEHMADSVEKEHVMVAMHILVEGREGLMLCDPGYHVARVITIMLDRNYPHTGWFTQSDEPHCKKDYNYLFNINNLGYIEWVERETRGTNVKYQTSLVYVKKPFQNAVNVTERRNLVYNFRSLLARDQKGHLLAGIYFPLVTKDSTFTLFFEDKSGKKRIKHKFAAFLNSDKLQDHVLDQVAMCNSQMNKKDGELHQIIKDLAEIMKDTTFINQVLELNEDICIMSADN